MKTWLWMMNIQYSVQWCVVELCTWILYNLVNLCHPNKFNKKEKYWPCISSMEKWVSPLSYFKNYVFGFWLLSLMLFLIIFCWLCYYSCPNLSPFAPFHPVPVLPQAIPTPLFMSMGHAYNFFGYFLFYTVLYIPMAIL